jgi:hypothetical protein
LRDRVLRDYQVIGPATLVHRRIRVQDESEDLIADLVASDARSRFLDDSGEVAPEG